MTARNQFIASLANEIRTRYSGSTGSTRPRGSSWSRTSSMAGSVQRWLLDWPLIGRAGHPAEGGRHVITTLSAIERTTPTAAMGHQRDGRSPSTYLLDWLNRVAGRFFETHLIDLTERLPG